MPLPQRRLNGARQGVASPTLAPSAGAPPAAPRPPGLGASASTMMRKGLPNRAALPGGPAAQGMKALGSLPPVAGTGTAPPKPRDGLGAGITTGAGGGLDYTPTKKPPLGFNPAILGSGGMTATPPALLGAPKPYVKPPSILGQPGTGTGPEGDSAFLGLPQQALAAGGSPQMLGTPRVSTGLQAAPQASVIDPYGGLSSGMMSGTGGGIDNRALPTSPYGPDDTATNWEEEQYADPADGPLPPLPPNGDPTPSDEDQYEEDGGYDDQPPEGPPAPGGGGSSGDYGGGQGGGFGDGDPLPPLDDGGGYGDGTGGGVPGSGSGTGGDDGTDTPPLDDDGSYGDGEGPPIPGSDDGGYAPPPEDDSGEEDLPPDDDQEGEGGGGGGQGQGTGTGDEPQGGFEEAGQQSNSGSTNQSQSGSHSESQNTGSSRGQSTSQGTSSSSGSSQNQSQSSTNVLHTMGLDEARNFFDLLGREAGVANPFSSQQEAEAKNLANARISASLAAQLEELGGRAGASGVDPNSLAVLAARQGLMGGALGRQLESDSALGRQYAQDRGKFDLDLRNQNIAQRGQDVSTLGLNQGLVNALLGQNESQSTSSGTSQNQSDSQNTSDSFNESENQGTSESDAWSWSNGRSWGSSNPIYLQW